MKSADCTSFLQWALPRLGMRWTGFRRVRGQVCKRVARRIAALGLKDLADYRALLMTDSEEWKRLDGLCRVSVSRFHRDSSVWRRLEREILPQLAERARARQESRLRIWSAGCASGEEPYSVALLFAFSVTLGNSKPEILATDADPHLLSRAHRARYPASSLREVPRHWAEVFQQSGDEYCLRARYRAPVRFLKQDVRRECSEGRFDLILCRNMVFTYFESRLQAVIARRLGEVLSAGGFLLLGVRETLPEPVPMLAQEEPWLYRRREDKGG